MARGRMISKSLSTSDKFARLFDVCPPLAEFCQSLYPLLNAHADDFGREQGDAVTVKFKCLPRSPRSVDDFGLALAALDKTGLIRWYQVKGRQFYQIVDFDKHQTGLHKRTRSHFPSIPGKSGNFPESPAQLKGRELNSTEGNLTEEKGTETDIRARDDNPSPHVEPQWNRRGPDRHRGLVDTHRPCFVSPACERGWCVPGWLVTREWLPQVSGDDGQIRRFIADVLELAPAGALGDEPLKFWRAMWQQTHGTRIVTAGRSRTSDTVDAGKEHLRRQIAEFMAEEGGSHVELRALES